MRTKSPSSQRKVPCASILIALTVIILFSYSQTTLAQQWSTSSNDISNTNSGNVGVGTSSPGVKLDILSSVSLIARFGSSAGAHSQVLIDAPSGFNSNLTLQRGGVSKWSMGNLAANDRLSFVASTGAVEVLSLFQNGNLGIGTTNPFSPGAFARVVHLRDPSHASYVVDAGGLYRAEFGVSLNGGWVAAYDALPIRFITGNAEKMRINSAGNVGIGTPAPNYKFDVQGGQVNASGGLCIAGDCKTNWSQVGGNGAVNSVFGRTGIVVAATNDYTWAQINKTVSSLADITTRNAGDLNSGTVPLARLGGGIPDTSKFLRGDNTWAVPSGGSQWATNGTTISYNAGSVGIGTASPGFLLDVFGSTDNPFRVRDSSGREYFSTTTRTGPFGTAPVVSIATGRLIIDNSGPDGGNDTIVRHAVNSLVFQPSDHPDLPGAFMVRQKGGSIILHVDQNTNGNVGIGTTTPGAKLEVVGNVTVNGTGNITAAGTIEGGNIKAKYQDVAEWVESSQELSAGTVVVLDHTKSNQVIASTQAYDTRVAGVISEQPGITLGEGGDNKVLVATTGRVTLTVDASSGPIQIGDLLVTSDSPGVAMKSQAINVSGVQLHRPGTLVGKALEPLAKGQGKILVLLSLQ
jgi:hypothetical protein